MTDNNPNNTGESTPLLPTGVFSVLDFFVPGSTRILTAAEKALDLNRASQFLVALGLAFFMSRQIWRHIWWFAETYFASKITIPYHDEVYEMVAHWMENQPFAQDARSSIVHVNWRDKQQQYRHFRQNNSGRGAAVDSASDDQRQKKPLHFMPWNGMFYFFFRGRLLWFRSEYMLMGIRMENVASVSGFASPSFLKTFVQHCREEYLKSIRDKISVFEHTQEGGAGGRWKMLKARTPRSLSTIIMDEETKADLVGDIESFLAPGAQRWHANRGIPYRRGYLLYGPPGTGKSSLCMALAGRFELDMYILSLSSIDGRALRNLFSELPLRCLILLEDVDAVGIARSNNRQQVSQDGKDGGDDQTSEGPPVPLGRHARNRGAQQMQLQQEAEQQQQGPGGRLALSDLLNTLDGVVSQEGRVLMMTTNHIEHLDPALVRAGRADRKIELPNATKDVAYRMFCMVFKRLPGDDDESADVETAAVGDTVKKVDRKSGEGDAEEDKVVERLAQDFAERTKEGGIELSPAEIQSFLLEHRGRPEVAVAKVEQWLERTRTERQKGGVA